MQTVYPCVPGHEIVGRVTTVGSAVTKFKPGDLVGVGCLVDADLSCPHCRAGNEQFSPTQVWTYGGTDKHLSLPTYGGYSESIVVDEHFSTYTSLPAWQAQTAATECQCSGVEIWTASTSVSSKIWRMSLMRLGA